MKLKRGSLKLVSFVGMKPQEQKIGKSTALNFILEEDATVLDQVVVNGVFERKANTFTGSVRTIGKDDLKRVGNSNVLQSLKNLDPSIMFFDNMSLGSDPNAMPEMVLRGKSSINMEDVDLKATYQNDPNAPLFVLDGFETSLSGYVIRDTERKLIWLVSGKLVYNKNKITRLSDAIKQQTEEYKLQEVDVNNLFYEGYSQNSIYAVRSLGIDPSTGNEIFLDKDGNITDTWNPSAKVYLGVNEPTFRGNASTMFMYKNLSLNLSFGFHWGGKLYNETLIDKVEVLRSSVGERNLDKRVLEDRWSEAGDLVFFKKISNVKTHATSRFVMNDRVFELQTATLQYKWESDFLKKANIQNMTFGINMSDVFYLSSVKRERGTSYPFARRVGMTVSLLF